MTEASALPAVNSTVDRAVAEGGAYEVLQRRLSAHGENLRTLAEQLNGERLAEFGNSELKLLGRLRVRSEHNCVARDIVQVGELLLFGYNVFLGLKRETQVADVFSLYRMAASGDAYDVEPVDPAGSFLAAPGFVNDFRELYAYYKHTRLLQLVVRDGQLLASFQIGERLADLRVFRWSVSPDGREVRYIDNRGERDLEPPAQYDFEWTRTTREDVVDGRHPHVNILDTVFVETVGGDLTVKIENNTEDGLGIYREPVSDHTQSLDDARIEHAQLGSLILLRILPYREEHWRHLVYSTLIRRVQRIDAIGQACVQLPEDHGIVYPGGYTLQNGDARTFDRPMTGMGFRRVIRAPNGEDVLYVFYAPDAGMYALFAYNLIERKLQPPIFAHGYARFADGRIVLFNADGGEPTRVHPMQVWQTPFASDEHAAAQPTGSSFHARVGNPELVRGVSDLLHLAREIAATEVSSARYEQLVGNTRRLFDQHHWFAETHCRPIAATLHEIATTGEAVLDEFEKVESIRDRSARALREALTRQQALLARLDPTRWERIQQYVEGLNAVTGQRGHLLTLREYRYIDVAALDAMEAELLGAHQRATLATAEYLASDAALQPFAEQLAELDHRLSAASAMSTATLAPIIDALATMSADLDMLSTLMASLPVDDPAGRTAIVEAISSIYARLNQTRARAEQRRREQGSAEAIAQFGAQFALFGQGVTGALSAAADPEACDEQLARVLVQLEELESRFGEHERFLDDILARREDVVEAFESRKQQLLDERQRKAHAVGDAAQRILDGLARRTATLADLDALNAFFAGDPLIVKLRELTTRLRTLRDSVKADDVEARLKAARDHAVRALRDQSELFDAGGDLIRLGRHRFSVNRQALDLTLIPHGDALCLHLTGTDFLEPVADPALDALRDYWQVSLESESAELYRGEYLAAELLAAAARGDDGLSLDRLRRECAQPALLEQTARQFAAPRYRDGYEKGIHDHDAAKILAAWLPLREAAGLLACEPPSRALAWLGWSALSGVVGDDWPLRAQIAAQLSTLLGDDGARRGLLADIAAALQHWSNDSRIAIDGADPQRAAGYLVFELADPQPRFSATAVAERLRASLQQRLRDAHGWDCLRDALARLDLAAGWQLARSALLPLCAGEQAAAIDHVDEAAALLLLGDRLPYRVGQAELRCTVDGLLGQHPRIAQGRMPLAVDRFDGRIERHRRDHVAGVRQFQAARHALLQRQRATMRLDEFRSRPLASFVRNRLIDQVYLPIIGDNLAKQIGAAGDGKRTDLMGLLLLISPPGYGKTTLMEYVAHRLGLIFMKINGPALGHAVRSLDPAQAPDATAARELEKLNLALEMGNNVMLYVDDIQHTHPEFLQKFISLCDGTRRIEGIWRGTTKTYDLRGKKFCVVMAGNPYTESGELFRIPDMLANRADVYNLGDVLGGRQDAFVSSYLENGLTSNPVLAPLATRDMADVYRLLDKAQGRDFSAGDLKHDYGSAEIDEIVAVLQRLIEVREVVYRVNQQYIASAAQADGYRSEPPFKLQGSYRNMNKLAEKITPVTNADELQQIIDDHYLGESQLLTSGAEENLLKLAELRGRLDAAGRARLDAIRHAFQRAQAIGGADADVGSRVVAQLRDLVDGLRALGEHAASPPSPSPAAEPAWPALIDLLERIASEQTLARTFGRDSATDSAMWLGGLRSALEISFKPLIAVLQSQSEASSAHRATLEQLAIGLQRLAAQLPSSSSPRPRTTDA